MISTASWLPPGFFIDQLSATDPELAAAIDGERHRQQSQIELIASENIVSRAVLEAQGSVLTNKYAEGYPGRRYYGGCEFVDVAERLAIDRAKQLFGCGFANVQPHAGAPANQAVFLALLKPGDTILGMDLSHGGHLTHGHPVTYLTKIFKFVRYKMKNVDTGEMDYDEMRAVAKREKPKMILAGYSAYPRELDYAKFVDIAKEVGAITVMDAAHIAGLIAGKACKNPFDYGFDIITTTTHKTLRGPRGGMILTRENEDYAKKVDKAVFPGFQGGPIMNTIAAKAVAFGEDLKPSFKKYAAQILKNAKAMEEVFHNNDIRMITGGTSNHLILADVFGSLGISGQEAEDVLDEVGMTLNKNTIADDTRKPMDPSGIRFGTPAVTTRGFKEKECKRVAELMIEAMKNKGDTKKKRAIHNEIKAMCKRFPIPDSFV
ncbi:MAG TPA: serine hydroxymethyltransferase [Candidatus Paceibacterota bacterium]